MARRLSALLMLLGLAGLWLPAVVAAWNAVAPHRLVVRDEPLAGVTLPLEVGLSSKTIVTGAWQRYLAKAAGPSIALYPTIVRVYNQALYSLYGLSTNTGILIGLDGYLLIDEYVEAYCVKDPDLFADLLRNWAADIAAAQAAIEARGQVFLFVVTPSKIEDIPSLLPTGFPCHAPKRDAYHAAAIAALEAARVRYVDANAHVMETRERYGYEPFPRNGIHYSMLAAHGAVNDIIAAINDAAGHTLTVPFEVRASDAKTPTFYDQDIGHLLNLLWLPPANRTALMQTVEPEGGVACPPPPTIAFVGGSFVDALGLGLATGPCPPRVVNYSYLVVDLRDYNEQARGIFRYPRPTYDLLNEADVVILEENASGLGQTRFVKSFVAWITQGIPPDAAQIY